MPYKNDLEFLQSLEERELCELVLMPLFVEMGFQDIRYVHGALEDGKDIVFSKQDPLDQAVRYCATVKRQQLSGSVSSSRSIRELYYQINQALKEPYDDPFTGQEVAIAKVYVVTPFPITNSSIHSIRSELRVPENRIAFIDGPKLYSLLRKHLPELLATLPDPELRYMDALVRRLTESGSQLARAHNRSLLDVYITSCVKPTTIEDAKLISFVRSHVEEKRSLQSSKFSPLGRFTVILADVGAGKTTFLQNIALDLASSNMQSQGERILPLLIPLHVLPTSAYTDEYTFFEAASQYLAQRHSYFPVKGLDDRSHLLLLDGFDEIPGSHREAATLMQRLSQHSFSGLVVTSRPSRIPVLSSPFSYYKLEPFSDDDIEEFLLRWFREDVILQQSVLSKIKADPSLSVFCRSPLLLTLYAVLAQKYPVTKLPVRRTDIYELVVDYLLGRWDDMRSIRNNFDKPPKEFLLEAIAFEAQKSGERVFSWSTIRQVAAQLFKVGQIGGTPEDLIGELIYRSSLLRPSGLQDLEFPHLSFQEYFAAKRLSRIPDSRLLDRVISDGWWRGTLVFYFGLKRSMDEIAVASYKKLQGSGLLLMELLVEADYTSERFRGIILKAVGADVLSNRNLSDAELEVCSRIGPRILEALSDILRRTESVDATNYFRLAFSMASEQSLNVIRSTPDLLSHLPLKELFFVLKSILPLAAERQWSDYWELVVDQVEDKLEQERYAPWILQGVVPDLAGILGEISSAAHQNRLRVRKAERLQRKLRSIDSKIRNILL